MTVQEFIERFEIIMDSEPQWISETDGSYYKVTIGASFDGKCTRTEYRFPYWTYPGRTTFTYDEVIESLADEAQTLYDCRTIADYLLWSGYNDYELAKELYFETKKRKKAIIELVGRKGYVALTMIGYERLKESSREQAHRFAGLQ